MTMPTNDNKDNMIFTLEDGQSSGSAEHYSDWEHSLDQLRHIRGSDAGADSALTRPVARTAEELQRDEVKLFGDAELESAYREFLRQNEAEHNARVEQQGAEEDVGILIQEDWLNAQSALQSEYNRRHQEHIQTLVLNPDYVGRENDALPEADADNLPNRFVPARSGEALPAAAVYVYALPALPSTRRIRVLSEQELVASLEERLKVHLSNAVAGMVRHVLQKKLATLAYDLQMVLNAETPQLVEEVLSHNMASIMRAVKDSLPKE